jgi:hypothetical protein
MENLINDINAFMARTGLSASAIGKAALNDPCYVYRLLEGRDTMLRTANKLRDWMSDYDCSRLTDRSGNPGEWREAE